MGGLHVHGAWHSGDSCSELYVLHERAKDRKPLRRDPGRILHAHDERYRGRRRGAHRRVRHTVVGRLHGERTTLDVHGIEVMGNLLLKIVLSSIVLVIMSGPSSAQDKGSVDPKPLPPLSNPNNPHLGAKELFARKILPASQAVHSIGFYAKGCLAGAQALPVNGKT